MGRRKVSGENVQVAGRHEELPLVLDLAVSL